MKMKLRFCKPILMLLCGATLLFALTTCGDPGTGAYVMNSEAILTNLTIGTGQYEVVAGGKLPETGAYPNIDSFVWDDMDQDVEFEEYGTINIKREADTVDSRIRVSASRNARVEWGIGDKRNRPGFFQDIRVPANFSSADFVYIRVESEDTSTVNYYRFYAWVLKNGVNLADLFIDNKRAEIKDGIDDLTLIDGLESGELNISEIGAVATDYANKIRAIGFDEDSAFRFAWVRNNSNAAPDFKTLGTGKFEEMTDDDPPVPNDVEYFIMTEDFEDLDTLYIEVTAQNQVDRAYYKFLLGVGRVATISKLTIGTDEIMGKGVPNTVWNSVRFGSYEVADQPGGGFPITIELEDPAANYEYVLIANSSTNPPAVNPGFNGTPETLTFDNTNALAIKVTSSKNTVIMYYKIRVELLAGLFVRHPESRVYYYYKDPDTVLPVNPSAPEAQWRYVERGSPVEFESDEPVVLDFELDRDIPGATYQWYESNSWYGGWGFDEDGRRCYLDHTGTLATETGFKADSQHLQRLDEKGNTSLINGGNQAAYYLLPGKPISGATSKTYKPKIDTRPLNLDFTNESHYYWVVITAPNGRKVTSGRATIISERDNRKKHHIIDVNNAYKPGGPGSNPKPFKNVIAFKKRYDKFRIPLTFPSKDPQDASRNYDLLDYTIMTAQAIFYLADGTPWIQNWTNGNLSFEDNIDTTDADGPDYTLVGPYGGGGNILVLYYNLTNNNATYMLDGDSKEPQGADLRTIPTHVVVEPSGDHTKGTTKDGYPPLGADGKAAASIVGEDLQGWFCGFVELVELRFEGTGTPRAPKP